MPPFILYLTEEGDKKTSDEILAELKTYAAEAPVNLRTCAEGLENGSISLGSPGDPTALSFQLQKYRAMRDNVAVFLREQGYEEVAEGYENSAPKFLHAHEISDWDETTPSDVADTLREIADIENRAYSLWE